MRHVVEPTTPQRNATSEQTQQIDRLPESTTRRTKPSPAKKCTKQLRWEYPSCSPNFKLAIPRLHSGAACDKPETNKISKLPPIPEVVWQQPTVIVTNQDNSNNTHNDSTLKTNVANQTSPPKGNQPQSHVVATEQPPGNQTGNEPVPFLTAPRIPLPISKIQNSM